MLKKLVKYAVILSLFMYIISQNIIELNHKNLTNKEFFAFRTNETKQMQNKPR